MGEFPNKATQFSKTNQPTPESKSKPKSINPTEILKKYLPIEKDMINPFTGLEDKLNISELIIFKLISLATQGDLPAIKEIIDRLEGKALAKSEVKQEIEQTTYTVKVKKRNE